MAALRRSRATWILILMLAAGFFLLREKRSLGLPPPVDVVISSAMTFAAADLSDGTADNTFTVTGNLTMTSGGSISCDNASGDACNIKIVVGGNMVMENGSKITANATGGSGNGGNIDITVGDFGASPPTGDFIMNTGAIIQANSAKNSAGSITINVAHSADVDGLVESKSGLTGIGANQPPGGGPITINAGCTLTVSDTGIVSSQGQDPGADLVHLEACVVEIDGIVRSFGPGHAVPDNPPNHCDSANRPDKPANSTGCVEIWAGDSLTISRQGSHSGEINADVGLAGQVGGIGWIDLFARGPITVLGDPSGIFAVHSNQGGTNGTGGIIHAASVASSITATGLAFQADDTGAGSNGGSITLEGQTNVTLDDSQIFARGDFVQTGGFGNGGHVTAQAFTGALSWINTVTAPASIGDVRPTGADTIPPVDVTAPPAPKRGVILLTACSALPTTTGTSFPFNGDTATTPTLATSCPGGPPVLQGYVSLPAANCGALCITQTPTPTPTRVQQFTPTPGNCPEDPNAVLTATVDPTGAIHNGLPNFLTLQPAYVAAGNGAVIGLFGKWKENVNLGGAKTLKITQCTSAQITALDGSLPVWEVSSTGKLTIVGPDSVGGTIGWLIDNPSGGPHTLKSVRANGASIWGIQINSDSNSVSWNDVSGNGGPGGILVAGSKNILKGGTTGPNNGDGIKITGDSNTVSGATVDSNVGNGILLSGSAGSNQIKSNSANLNGGDGFRNAGGSGNSFSGNNSNTGGKENVGAEYSFVAAGVNGGSNRADGINVPKLTIPTKCPDFAQANTVCE